MLVSTPPQVSGGCFPFFPSTSLMPGSVSPSVLMITLCVVMRIRQVLGESRERVSDEEENEREVNNRGLNGLNACQWCFTRLCLQ